MKQIFALIRLSVFLVLLMALPSSAAADEYKIDPEHTSVVFKIGHLDVSYTWGRFNTISGNLSLNEDDPSASSITIEIDVNSIDTNNEKRDKHLRGPDFFNVKTYPKATFKSKSFKVKGDNYTVVGDFTLHGQTREVTLEVVRVGSGKDPWGGFRTGFSGELALKRSDYGIKGLIGPVADDLVLFLDVEAIKQ